MEEQYKLAIQALENIGITKYPKFKDIKITNAQKKIKNTQLVITPEISKDFTFYDLVHKYDPQPYIYHELWDQYELSGPMTVSLVLLDGDNQYDEDVLVHTNKCVAKQRELVSKSPYDALGPTTYIMLNIIRRLQAKEPLNQKTWLRYIGLKNKLVDGDSVVGRVFSRGGKLRLGWDNGFAYPRDGVGLSVGLELNTSASSLPDSFASDLQENTEAIKELTEFLRGVFK